MPTPPPFLIPLLLLLYSLIFCHPPPYPIPQLLPLFLHLLSLPLRLPLPSCNSSVSLIFFTYCSNKAWWSHLYRLFCPFERQPTQTSVLFFTTRLGCHSAYRSSEHLSFSLPSFVLVLSREFIKENTKVKKHESTLPTKKVRLKKKK